MIRMILRIALRSVIRSARFSIPTICILSFCFGFVTLLFTLVQGVLLKPLPYKDPDRLVWIWATRTDRDKAFFSIPNFEDIARQNRTLERFVGFGTWGVNLTGRDNPQRLQGIRISADAFQMLGVGALAGRTLLPSDDKPDSPAVVLLSFKIFQTQFGNDPGIIGQKLILNGDPYVVIGILPRNFMVPNADTDVVTALKMYSDPRRTDRGTNFLRAIALLKPNVSLEQTRSDLAMITDRLSIQYPADNAKLTAPTVKPLLSEIVGDYPLILNLLFGAVAIVLLIACSNLAHLILARGVQRHRELALRSALGAGSRQIALSILAENLMLVLPAGLAGILIALLGRQTFLKLAPADLPRATEITFNPTVCLFALIVAMLVSLFFSWLVYRQTKGLDIPAQLKGKDPGPTPQATRMRNLLVVSEIALSVVLLLCASLWFKTFLQLQGIDPGFNASRVASIKISFPAVQYSTAEKVRTFYEKLSAALLQIPRLEAVGAANVLPLSGLNSRTDFAISERPSRDPRDLPGAQIRWVSPGYFSTLQIPIRKGRDFTIYDQERSVRVAIIDVALAKKYWQDADPIGGHINMIFTQEHQVLFEIIGIAGNVKHNSLTEETTATLYAPLFQIPEQNIPFLANNMCIVVRSGDQASKVADAVREKLRTIDPDIPVSSVKMMEDFVSQSMASRRFVLRLMLAFGVIGLLLSAVGLYAVLSHLILQRSHELGIRIAIGAQSRDVIRLILKQGIKLFLPGFLAGLVTSVPAILLIKKVLGDLAPFDPGILLLVTLILVGVALPACWFPARRATSCDPIKVLKSE